MTWILIGLAISIFTLGCLSGMSLMARSSQETRARSLYLIEFLTRLHQDVLGAHCNREYLLQRLSARLALERDVELEESP